MNRVHPWSLVLANVLVGVGSAVAQPLVPTYVDVAYGSDPMQKVDVYLAPSSGPTPVLIEIHGGGWAEGVKSEFNWYLADANGLGIIEKVVAKGISVVSINYRLVTVTGQAILNTFPTGNLDVVRAIQFVRANAAAWNIDPERVGIVGRSAGGHLGLWAALSKDFADPQAADPVVHESSRPIAMVSCWTPTDFAPPSGLLCSTSRPALCLYMGVAEPSLLPTVPLSKLQAASPTWLAVNGAGPDKVREVALLNLYSGPPGATMSSQIPSPTDDPHSILFSFLIKEALQSVGHDDVHLYHQMPLTAFKGEATDTAALFLNDRLRRPLPSITPDPDLPFDPLAFAPMLRVNLGDLSAAQYLADMAAMPAANSVLAVLASTTLFLPLTWAQLTQLDQAGYLDQSASGNELAIAFHAFPLAFLGTDPWLALAVWRNGTLYWSRRTY